jgi:hypothetical protein
VAGAGGRSRFRERVAGAGGRSRWQEQVAGAGGRSGWQEQVSGAGGRSGWQEQTVGTMYIDEHVAETQPKTFLQTCSCLLPLPPAY